MNAPARFRWILVSQAIAAASVIGASVLVTLSATGGVGARSDNRAQSATTCVPSELEIGPLNAGERMLAISRAALCRDFEAGRITRDEYVRGIDRITDSFSNTVRPPAQEWAARVISHSSEYTSDSWGAGQVLGPPNVYPSGGDSASAWAPLSQDGGEEVIEVSFDGHRRASAIEIYETYNPGAITRVELLTADGRWSTLFQGSAEPLQRTSNRRRIETACTDSPVIAARVTLDTAAVPGWNELDAIALLPCPD